jgi:hypothetical protein
MLQGGPSLQGQPELGTAAFRVRSLTTSWSLHPEQDVKEEYAEMREEFLAGLEDRRYLPIAEARAKRLQVLTPSCCVDPNQMRFQ